jgi:hypothetical protein
LGVPLKPDVVELLYVGFSNLATSLLLQHPKLDALVVHPTTELAISLVVLRDEAVSVMSLVDNFYKGLGSGELRLLSHLGNSEYLDGVIW